MRKFILLFIIFSTAALAGQPVAYGPTNDNDQLWQIAVSLRPNTSVTVEQTMLAILKANPDAFVDGNAYRLKSGYVLSIPTTDVIRQVSAESAAKKIEKQHNIFLGVNTESNKEIAKKEVKVYKSMVEEFEQKMEATSQQYQERLGTIEQQNQELKVKIKEVDSNLNDLRQEIKKEHEERSKHHQIFSLSGLLHSYEHLVNNFFSADELKLLAALAFVLIIWWSLLHYRRSKQGETKKPNYDFMSGEEGMNAKLDLARAYIDMSDKESARKVLAEVRGFGNNKQKAEAEELLKKCV
jgi:pilus assembly protein FimV